MKVVGGSLEVANLAGAPIEVARGIMNEAAAHQIISQEMDLLGRTYGASEIAAIAEKAMIKSSHNLMSTSLGADMGGFTMGQAMVGMSGLPGGVSQIQDFSTHNPQAVAAVLDSYGLLDQARDAAQSAVAGELMTQGIVGFIKSLLGGVAAFGFGETVQGTDKIGFGKVLADRAARLEELKHPYRGTVYSGFLDAYHWEPYQTSMGKLGGLSEEIISVHVVVGNTGTVQDAQVAGSKRASVKVDGPTYYNHMDLGED